MANDYTRTWFDSFLATVPEDWTKFEIEAITALLPVAEFSRVIDVCCGPGRHAALLTDAGYDVVGVDRDVVAINEARRAVPSASFLEADQRELRSIDGPFDAAMILWQSFGYFDSDTNDRILGDIASLLRPGGRLLLDLYHPGFVETHAGRQTADRAPECDSILNTVEAGRLVSTISYRDGSEESMDFELFWPDDLITRCDRQDLRLVESCAGWDRHRAPTDDVHRYQLVLERRGERP